MASQQQMMAEYIRRMQLDPTAPPITMESQVAGAMNAPMTPGTGGFGAPPVPTDLAEQAMRERAMDYTSEQAAVDSQREIAQAMRSGKSPEGRTVGPLGVYVAPNWGDVAGDVAMKLGGGYLEGKANTKGEEMDAKRSESKLAQAMEEQRRQEAEESMRLKTYEEAVRSNLVGEENAADKLGLLENADARAEEETKVAGEWQLPGRDTPIRGYTKGGVAYQENGEPMPDGAAELVKATRASGSRFSLTRGTDANGNDVFMRFDKSTGDQEPFQFIDGTPYDAETAKDFGAVRAEQGADEKGAETVAAESAKSNQTKMDGLEESIPALRNQMGLYNEALGALADGARTGVLEGQPWVPTISSASKQLENVQQRLGLEQISQHTFGSLSEAEGQWVRESSIPLTMDQQYLPDFIMRKAQAAERILIGQEFELMYRQKTGKAPPQALMKKAIMGKDGEYADMFQLDKSWLKGE